MRLAEQGGVRSWELEVRGDVEALRFQFLPGSRFWILIRELQRDSIISVNSIGQYYQWIQYPSRVPRIVASRRAGTRRRPPRIRVIRAIRGPIPFIHCILLMRAQVPGNGPPATPRRRVS